MMTKQERTQSIIDNFRGNDDEFAMLKGVLCADHKFDRESEKAFDELIDSMMIAERMDELQAQARNRR